MDKDQISKQESLDKIEDCRNENLVELTHYPGIIRACDILKASNDKIKSLTPVQAEDETGVAIDKSALKVVYVDKILINSRPICAYLYDNEDMTNFKKFNYSESELLTARNPKLLIAGNAVFKFGTDNLIDLTGHVTVLSLAAINAARDAFLPKSNLPAEIKTEGGLNTVEINATFAKVSKQVRYIYCNALGAIKESSPTLYNKMMALAHDIKVGVRSHHAASVVTGIVDFKFYYKGTNEPAVGIIVKAVGIDKMFSSDENGMLEIEMPIGDHEIKIIGFDIEAMVFPITVVAGEQLIEKEITPIIVV